MASVHTIKKKKKNKKLDVRVDVQNEHFDLSLMKKL